MESLFNDMRILKRENDRLNQWLARSDQQIEWLSKENAALRQHAEEVTKGLIELRGVQIEALAVVRERVARDAAEIEKLRGYVKLDAEEAEKWRERYYSSAAEIEKWKAEAGLATEWYKSYKHQAETSRQWADKLRNELATTNKIKEEVAAHARKLEAGVKGLTGRPGTISIGNGGVYVLGFGTPSQEVLDAAESLRAEHYRNTDDEWYSCPKSGECWNDLAADVCTCGADATNAAVDVVLAYLTGGGE